MNIPIGIDDFGKLREEDYSYVDKSRFIEEVISNRAEVLRITRPRRFGKTLNMSMLAHFFDNRADNRHLFKGLQIESRPCFEEIGTRPVIFLSFKELKTRDYQTFLMRFREMMARLYIEHEYLLENLSEFEKDPYRLIAAEKAEEGSLMGALLRLTRHLEKHHGKKVVMLIDEYDSPIDEAYQEGFYESLITFMRGTLGSALKSNTSLHKAVLTGILRISKESIFSDLNHVEVHTVLSSGFVDYFGFTEKETLALLERANRQEQMDEVRRWYNGYQLRDTVIYNPWSLLNFLKQNGELKPYWVNTSDNNLIHALLTGAHVSIQETLEELINGGTVTSPIYAQTTLRDLDEEALWSLLLFSGYLTVDGHIRQGDEDLYKLRIPNQEVRHLYKNVFHRFVIKRMGRSDLIKMLNALTQAEIETFEHYFQRLVSETLSYYDTAGDAPERVYHAFVLGLLANLDYRYHVRSNRESGFGRYDLMMIPKDKSERGVIMEFKLTKDKSKLDEKVQAALDQIKAHNYAAELHAQGIVSVTELGIAFCGKQVMVRQA